ncbi:uncharacterized protein PODANS_5_7010 [Podospora anserina S mat+]|uniref:Podospora anserina S mat+ genomic DNA chromosome 5, supercontig 8 n=1 Tax=Podospora anserina (strain S / ATCC MYA-4624 / DSM 980 / FGSC 10383) TaxID=515849 RepID=B2AMJ6_PODAN|nr:uncharacterized protein PODANS_5_7010 [Podospora anserina S mat+]CAP65119.1 unnamed protein product [Podospora anserina S mat+]CDP29792.1 Putative protein of unknown function [Podospora anserina S mat+]
MRKYLPFTSWDKLPSCGVLGLVLLTFVAGKIGGRGGYISIPGSLSDDGLWWSRQLCLVLGVMTMARLWFVGAAALGVSLASAQAVISAQGCTSRSFTIPSWFVEDLTATEGGASFSLLNRATNQTAEYTCQGGNCSAEEEIEDLVASVQISGTRASVSVNQTWSCSDRTPETKFTAAGTASVPLTDGKADSSPLLVKGSLLQPVALTPRYNEGPTGHDTPGCLAKSENPSWVLSHVIWADQDGDEITSVKEQRLTFILTNLANGYEASCMSQGPVATNIFCAGTEFQSFTIGRYSISTAVQFDPATYSVTVNQTWFCDDHNPAKPLQISATGTLPLPLLCTTEPIPSSPTHLKKFCTVPTTDSTVSLTGTLGTIVTLQPYSIEDPVPATQDSCTLSSIYSPKWQFSYFSTYNGSISFEIILQTNRGFRYPNPVYQGKSAGDGWWECEMGYDGGAQVPEGPLWPYKCQFRWDEGRKELSLRAEWECLELDAENPVRFSGVSTATVNSNIVCEKVEHREYTDEPLGEGEELTIPEPVGVVDYCYTENPSYAWVGDVKDVTWTSGKSL